MILNNSFINTLQFKVLKATKKALSEEVDSAFSILSARIAGKFKKILFLAFFTRKIVGESNFYYYLIA